MSYEIRAFCRPVCDQPGCDATVETLDYNWFSDTDYAEDIAAEQMWQVICGDAMHARHYCPKHTHAECTECGRRETGEYLTLEGNGWDDLTDVECTLCPMCVRLPAINPCGCGGTPALDYGGNYEGLTLMGNHAAVTCPDCGRTVSDDAPTTLEDIAREVIESWNETTNPQETKTVKEEH